MKYNPQIHHRRSIRLKGYDYSQAGLYFITICCGDRKCRFGEIVVGASLADAQNSDAQNADAQNADAQNADAQNSDAQNADAQNADAQNADAQNADAQNADAHNSDAQNADAHNADAQNADAQNADAQNSDAQNADAQNADAQNSDAQNSDAQNSDAQMILNEYGTIAYNEWIKLAERFSNFELDVFQIMPNHMHGIILLNDSVEAGFTSAPNDNDKKNTQLQMGQPLVEMEGQPQRIAPTVGGIVGAYKSLVANACLDIYKTKNETMGKLWQRNYHEHIIRNEKSYQTISDYIINNPAKWNDDKFFSTER